MYIFLKKKETVYIIYIYICIILRRCIISVSEISAFCWEPFWQKPCGIPLLAEGRRVGLCPMSTAVKSAVKKGSAAWHFRFLDVSRGFFGETTFALFVIL